MGTGTGQRRHRAALLVATAATVCAAAAGTTALVTGARAQVDTPAAIIKDPCFGAASHDPGKRCVSPALATAVVPSPAATRRFVPGGTCEPVSGTGKLFACGWGAPSETAVRTVALLGDSQAAHWRPAMERMAKVRNWRGVSMSRPGCPITTAVPKLPTRGRSLDCMRWNRAVQRWLARHPEISVVFVGQHRGRVVPRKGQSSRDALVGGYLGAWRKMLAKHVRRIVVFRGAPRAKPGTLDCVSRAMVAGRNAGQACAISRAYALPKDPAAYAATLPGTPRVQVADLSNVFCGPRTCPPVIGGALVHRDTEHLNRLFVASLSPFLLKVVNRLSSTWRDPVKRSGDVRPLGKVGNLPGSSSLDPQRRP